MFEIGKRIKTLRQQRGWSQGDIAELLNISVPAFSKIESDVTDVNISRLNQIAETFGVRVIDLISTQVEPSQSLLDELKEAKDTIVAQSAKINHLQEYIITLYEQLQKKQAQDIITG
ncbi:helix-turn-helix transcriptional regulator [Mucilaginibacter sp.]|uniref:helix-turn-helix domain-containing protein n=1 Tax=Mucilaginibacter sp. TaxID=1882438 RepID=UPI00260AD569|nr:helix-turn-helix transcriptional regulator [Mucilaginibacter sp.]MDB5030796.1 transcriptional regulator [Mucilaginibacter sp.]